MRLALLLSWLTAAAALRAAISGAAVPHAAANRAAVAHSAGLSLSSAAVHSRGSPRMALKLDLSPAEAARLLEDGPAASQGPFGKGGALEWVASFLDGYATLVLFQLHLFDDKAVQDSSKNLQVLWSRAVLAKNGALDDPIAFEMLPESTRWVVTSGLFDGVVNFLEWVSARTAFLNEGTDAFLSSAACSNGAPCQAVVLGAGFDTRSVRYQREGLTFFEVDLPETIAAKRVVHERYKATADAAKVEGEMATRLPTLVGWDLNECERASLLDHLEKEHGLRRDVPTLFISEAVMFYVDPPAIAALYDDIFSFGQGAEAMYCFTDSMRPFVQVYILIYSLYSILSLPILYGVWQIKGRWGGGVI